MKKSILVLLAAMAIVFLTACDVSHETAQEVLTDEGYHNIQLTGHAWFGCSSDDKFASTFTAQRWVFTEDGSRDERTVNGTLCCGWWKDCTVRH